MRNVEERRRASEKPKAAQVLGCAALAYSGGPARAASRLGQRRAPAHCPRRGGGLAAQPSLRTRARAAPQIAEKSCMTLKCAFSSLVGCPPVWHFPPLPGSLA